MTSLGDKFHEWCERSMCLASYTGRNVPDAERKITAIVELWAEPVPAGWERPEDRRLLDSVSRYLRNHIHGRPTPGSEHELEHQILCPTPATEVIVEPDGRLVDGVNAVPLARDQGGHRAGNVEADMLLLIQHLDGRHELLLVEAKTTSNTAWYAVVENLRQNSARRSRAMPTQSSLSTRAAAAPWNVVPANALSRGCRVNRGRPGGLIQCLDESELS